MNGNDNNYHERSSAPVGEPLFEAWCMEKQFRCIRYNIDESIRIPRYWEINPILRNVPDYLVITPKGKRVVQVKGTYNLKHQEYLMIPEFIKNYGTPKVPLYYAFCVRGENPVVLPAERVIVIYDHSGPDKQWESDGKIYRTLDLTMG